jgi:triacylglycerol esterase/lipase EstA (alpha/beta hydrolase family)
LPFLNALHQKDTTTTLAILALGHIGHSPVISAPQSTDSCGLASQVESVARVLNALKLEYGGTAKVALVGHSIGAWMSLQVPLPIHLPWIFLTF